MDSIYYKWGYFLLGLLFSLVVCYQTLDMGAIMNFQENEKTYDILKKYTNISWSDLVDLYKAPGRVYHNNNHIAHMLETHINMAFPVMEKEDEALRLAILFHDVIIGAEAEIKSAAFLLEHAKDFDDPVVKSAVRCILATQEHTPSALPCYTENPEDQTIMYVICLYDLIGFTEHTFYITEQNI
jgi:hypothetical protein